MVENRWQILIAATVLLLMLLIATFSLGVYVGRYGFDRAGLRYNPPNTVGVGPPADIQQKEQVHIPQTAPDLIGRIRSVTMERIDLATSEGPRSVELADEFLIEDETGEPLRITDLHPGDVLALYGHLETGDGRHLVVNHIIRLPQKQPNQP